MGCPIKDSRRGNLQIMKTKARALGQAWRSTRLVLCGALLVGLPGCICIHNQVMIPTPAGSYAAPSKGSAPPSGGNFAPVQAAIIQASGTATVCNQTVSKTHVEFWLPTIPGPTAGETHFQGWLVNLSTGQIIANNTYVLQWIISFSNKGCATPVSGSGTDVRFTAQAGASYKIAAHFKPNQVPPNNPQIELRGAWIVL